MHVVAPPRACKPPRVDAAQHRNQSSLLYSLRRVLTPTMATSSQYAPGHQQLITPGSLVPAVLRLLTACVVFLVLVTPSFPSQTEVASFSELVSGLENANVSLVLLASDVRLISSGAHPQPLTRNVLITSSSGFQALDMGGTRCVCFVQLPARKCTRGHVSRIP